MFKVDPKEGKQALGGIFKKVKDGIKEIITEPLNDNSVLEAVKNRAVIEGIEEVTEQAAIDMSKGVVDFLNYVTGSNSKASFGGFNNVFSQKVS